MQIAATFKQWRQSLTFRMIVLGVAMVLVGGAIRYSVTSVMLTEGLMDTVGAQQISLANYVAQDINGKIAARQKLLEQLAREIPLALLDQPQALEAWLEERHNLAPLFSLGLVVVPADGKSAIADYPPLGGRRTLDFNERDWFIAARDAGSFAIGKPTVGRAAYQGVVQMAMPVKSSDGRLIAVLMGVTALSMPGFWTILNRTRSGAPGACCCFPRAMKSSSPPQNPTCDSSPRRARVSTASTTWP